MRFLSGQNLVDGIRGRCDRLKKRLWIASPFIGDWYSVRKILGRKWVDDENVNVRLITDDMNIDKTAYRTIGHFQRRGPVKSLRGLHAKIYIMDDHAVVTSANLTGTAFFRRYEAGVLLSGSSVTSVMELYRQWWGQQASRFPEDFVPKVPARRARAIKEEVSGTGLPKLWREPTDPGDPYGGLTSEFRDYPLFLRCYRDFADTYLRIQRVWSGSPLYFETDAFLNYLFHEAPGKPSKKYRRAKPRRIDATGRNNEIRKYAARFSQWLSSGEKGVEDPQWRPANSRLIKSRLAITRITSISGNDVRDVVDCLHCMNAYPANKSKFLNDKKNDLSSIRNAWNNLLHGKEPLETRMTECHRTLRWFGRSSIQELVGFFYPDKYPLRNSNSNAGLRFFGYHLPAY
jgi:hypothetical protein